MSRRFDRSDRCDLANLEALHSMIQALEAQTRSRVIGEIQAFASEYHHHVDGRDVVIVDQLVDFLRGIADK